MPRWLVLLATHVAMLAVGFVIGIYALPILTAPEGPSKAAIEATAGAALFKGRFDRGLKGSDFVHWGEGEVRVLLTRSLTRGAFPRAPTTNFISLPSSSTRKRDSSRSRLKPDASVT